MMFDGAQHIAIEGKNAIRIAIEGVTVWKGLPKGYTKLDYIEVTGTQYINTGFVPNQDSRIVCEFLYKGGSGVYGARTAVSSNNFSMRVISSAWQLGYGDGVKTGSIPADTTNWHVADQNKYQLYIDGELASEREYEVFTAPYPAAIGAIRGSSLYYGQGRYRTCQLYDNGTLVRDFIPCLNPNGKPGMYDTLNAKFYGNAGTGEFLYSK